jgi:hypothetical protein
LSKEDTTAEANWRWETTSVTRLTKESQEALAHKKRYKLPTRIAAYVKFFQLYHKPKFDEAALSKQVETIEKASNLSAVEFCISFVCSS